MVDILNSLDILAVQEHWLTKQSLSFLNSVHSDFNARGIISIDYSDGLSGLCFLWRRSLDPFIEPLIYFDEKRLLGLKITSSNATILLLNVYLPYQTDDNADEYLEILGKIQAISDSFESTNTFIIGDFNADIKNPSLFTPFLNAFINDCHLIASDTLLLPSDAFTYASDAHGSRSWLDHVLTTHSSHSSISDMEVKYVCVSSDHLPLCFSIYAKLLPSSEATIQEQIHAPRPVWNAASPQDLDNYHTQTGLLLSAIDVPHEVLRYTNPNCNDEAHRTLLSNLYNDIVKSLKDAAEVIPTKANNTSSKYTVLGWNDLVRDSHQAARVSFLFWRSAGSPRHGPLYDIMKIKRAHFKRNKRLCEKKLKFLKLKDLLLNYVIMTSKTSGRT